MKSDKYIAVDLGSTQIRTLAAQVLPDNSVRVFSAEVKNAQDVRYGIIEQSSGLAYKISELIKLLHNSAKLQPRSATFFSSVNAKSMHIELISFSKDFKKTETITTQIVNDLSDACEKDLITEEKEVYDLIPISYELDGITSEEPEGKQARVLTGHYHAVVGNSQIKQNIIKCFERMVGYRPESFPFLSIEAIALAASEEHERKEGCAVIDLGATTTTVGIYKDELLQDMIVVPLGGNHITNDIKEVGISWEHAEKLKCLKGNALELSIENPIYVQIPSAEPGEAPQKIDTRFLATIIEARLDEMLQPVFELIDTNETDINKIILTGNGAKMNGIIEYLEARTGFEVRFGDHTGWLTLDTPDKYKEPQYAQLIGTVLLAHEYRTTHQEVIETKTKEKQRSGRGIFAERFADNIIKFFEDDKDLQ